jgi:phospho-N-acetylmuramoyl-pentapeptide-transferase
MLYLLLDWTRTWLIDAGLYRFVSVLDQIQFRALAAAGLSFFFVVTLGRPTIKWLLRQKIGDAGATDAESLRAHASSKANTPTMGGVLIIGAILGSIALLADLRQFYLQLGAIVLIWLAVLGAFDDWLKLTASRRGTGSRQGLRAWEKLVFQIGLGLLVGYFAFLRPEAGLDSVETALAPAIPDVRHVLNLPLQKTYIAPEMSLNPSLIFLGLGSFITIAVLMITGMSNAVNLADGMDGLAAGTTGAVSLGLLVLTFIARDQATAQYLLVPYVPDSGELTVLTGAVAGACLGFLWWNCSPAQVFMGDTGSLALGGVLAYIGLIIRQEYVVLVMCGIFLIEAGSVALQVGYFKATKGKRIFRCAPYHHHLHMGGWTEQQVVIRFWIITVLLVVVGLASIKLR